MNSTMEKLLMNIVKKEPEVFEEDETLKVKQECVSEDDQDDEEESDDTVDGERLFNQVNDFLASKDIIKSDPDAILDLDMSSSPLASFGETRVYSNGKSTWELKPNQMYDSSRDNGSIRGRHLILENATYRNNGTKKDTVYWRCIFPNCRSRLSTNINGDRIIKYPSRHGHRVDGLDAKLLDAKRQLRQATTSSQIKTVVENIKANYPEYVQRQLKTNQIGRSNRRQKQKGFDFSISKFIIGEAPLKSEVR